MRVGNFDSVGTVEACAAKCTSEATCMSFGLWDQDAHDPGKCMLWNKACSDTCSGDSGPTNVAGGWTNKVYNKEAPVFHLAELPAGYTHAGENCNCGSVAMRVGNFDSVGTVEACAAKCTSEATCMSFGLWDQDAHDPGKCMLWNKACSDTCSGDSGPTNVAGGWTNKVYNKEAPARGA